MTESNIIREQISDCLSLLQTTFSSDIAGVYLYGSYLMGGLQRYSDLDLFVVLKRKSTIQEQGELINALLEISGVYMKEFKRPIELTIVEQKAIKPWRYPPSFDFQYGEWLREAFAEGKLSPWSSKQMSDLAIIITQLLLRSETLLGDEPSQTLAVVPYGDFIKAMLEDIDKLLLDIDTDTRNVLLTMARIWMTLVTNQISSKPIAAD